MSNLSTQDFHFQKVFSAVPAYKTMAYDFFFFFQSGRIEVMI